MMSKLNDALDDSEYELVVEALMRLREIKIEALAATQQDPATQSMFTPADFGIDAVHGLLRKLDVSESSLVLPDAEAMKGLGAAALTKVQGPYTPPRVGIRTEGGVIQTVFSNVPVVVDLIGYPDDEDAIEECMHQVEWNAGQPTVCEIIHYTADVLPGEFPKIDAGLAAGPIPAKGARP